MVPEPHESSAVAAAENLIRESDAVREKLAQERSDLIARLHHIDRIMSALPRSSEASAAPVQLVGPDSNVAQLVKAVVAAHKEGIDAPSVTREVLTLRRDAPRKLIRSSLHRLWQTKKIKRRGVSGRFKYFLDDGSVPTRAPRTDALDRPTVLSAIPARKGSKPGAALVETAKLVARQHDPVTTRRVGELANISTDAARIRLRRALGYGLIAVGPEEGTFVAPKEAVVPSG